MKQTARRARGPLAVGVGVVLVCLVPCLMAGAVAAIGGAGLSSETLVPFRGYAWSRGGDVRDNLIPFAWLTPERLDDPAALKELTDRMPVGHRVVFLWHVDRGLIGHPKDRCRTVDGTFAEANSIWLDHGVARVRDRLDRFFRAYKRMGGELDVVVVDWEGGLSVWQIGEDNPSWPAIEADPRFADVASELGFSDITTVAHWWLQLGDRRLNYLRWNALMAERMAAYLNRAIYDPIRTYYPKVRLSNYGYYHHARELGVPDLNGHRGYLFGHGAHVGTHQSAPLYSRLGQIMWRPPEGAMLYPHTPFNGFRHALNKMRCMVGASDVPVYPWVAYRAFSEGFTGVSQHDLYQELIFHVGLSGPDAFLYWNPRPWKDGQNPSAWGTDEQDRLFSDCLHRLTELVGQGDRHPVASGLVPWTSHYALSGMRAGGRTVWRFTPNLKRDAKRASTLISRSPATFQVGKKRISIPGGEVVTPAPQLSTQGYWIIAPAELDASRSK